MVMKLPEIIIRVFLAVTSVWLFFCGVIMAVLATFTIGVFFSIALGIFLGAVAVFLPKINALCQKGFFKFIKFLVCAGLIFLTAVVSFLAIYGNSDSMSFKEDAVIVLGAGLRGTKITYPLAFRLESALEYAEINKNAKVVVSGGMGKGENISEAEAMKNYLVRNGVEESRIIMEDKSTSTYENLTFSKEILDKTFQKDYTCVIITNSFHIFRAYSMAKKIGLDCTHMGAEIKNYSIPVNYLREFLAVIKFSVFGN